MKHVRLRRQYLQVIRAALLGACLALPQWSVPADAQTVSDSRIVTITLSSGGLAEIRHNAHVEGDGTLDIDVPLDQIDDLLKSLVVLDAAGSVEAVTLDGLSPVEEVFKRLPFEPHEMGSTPDLAAALQGVAARASSGGRTVEGLILGVGAQQAGTDDAPRTEHILSVMTESGTIETLRLGSDTVLEILDQAMRDKLRDAATVSGRGRTDDIRSVTIKLSGEGARDIGLSYVVPAPVWKTAYRLLSGGDEQARLQAWAVIENATGEDWEDVSLTLSSGAPVTLAQRLHQRYWHERPEIPVMAGSAEPPRPDVAAGMEMAASEAAPRRMKSLYEQSAPADMAANIAPAPAAGEAQALEGETTATYRLPAPVDLAAGRSLSVPFIDTDVPAERVSVFQPERNQIYPVAAVFLENGTAASLPPGIVTVYDRQDGYVGDAQLMGIPAGESRMASFADDRKVEITTDSKPQEAVSRIAIADGTLRATRLTRVTTTYSIKGAADAPRTILIEHPRRAGWRFSSKAQSSATPTHHRLRVEVEEGGTAEVEAVMERSDMESFALVDADADALYGWAGAAADSGTAAMLKELAELRRQTTQAERAVDDIQRDLERAAENQARIRDNMASVPSDSGLGQRYMAMLEEEEDRIAEMNGRRRDAESALKELRGKVTAFISAL